jgi:hypothetical protein
VREPGQRLDVVRVGGALQELDLKKVFFFSMAVSRICFAKTGTNFMIFKYIHKKLAKNLTLNFNKNANFLSKKRLK